jgi:hypothetical protein
VGALVGDLGADWGPGTGGGGAVSDGTPMNSRVLVPLEVKGKDVGLLGSPGSLVPPPFE